MLTGQRLFTGETVSHVLGAVLQVEPRWDVLPTAAPEPLRRLLRRCLKKERKRRLRDVGDALTELDEALAAPPSSQMTIAPVTQPGGWWLALPWVAGIVVAMTAGFAGWALAPTPPQPVSRFAVSVSPSAPVSLSDRGNDVAISPDGSRVVYRVAGDDAAQLYVRALDQLESVPLRGTERAENPFLSPHGDWVGFMAGGAMQKVSILGGSPVTICALPAELRGASWGSDDMIVFGTAGNSGLMRVSAAGGDHVVRGRAP